MVRPKNHHGVVSIRAGFKSGDETPDIMIGPRDTREIGAADLIPGAVTLEAFVIFELCHSSPNRRNVLVIFDSNSRWFYRIGIEVKELFGCDEG